MWEVTHFVSANQWNFFSVTLHTGSPVIRGKWTDFNIKKKKIANTQGRGEKEGKVLANHLNEESCKRNKLMFTSEVYN